MRPYSRAQIQAQATRSAPPLLITPNRHYRGPATRPRPRVGVGVTTMRQNGTACCTADGLLVHGPARRRPRTGSAGSATRAAQRQSPGSRVPQLPVLAIWLEQLPARRSLRLPNFAGHFA